MKNTWKMTAWAVVVALTVALILAGCGGDDGDDNGPNLTNGNLGENLVISGKQVYRDEWTGDEFGSTPYSGNVLTVFTGYWDDKYITSEVGTISGSGRLNLTISGPPLLLK